ncbi:MAG: hypothetical protein EKK55_24380 [Rhodocyclaceae bacterium]|nr:MAG: hypothetical protein EKK55_24380 [Rhodocyclaceae bacterium]
MNTLDLDELLRFAGTLWQHAISRAGELDEDLEVEVRSLLRRDGKVRPLHGYRAASTLEGIAALIRRDLTAGADVFVGHALRRRGSASGGDASVAAVFAVPADVDCAKHGIGIDDAIAALDAHPAGGPGLIVASGGGVHGYWLLDERVDVALPGSGDAFAAASAQEYRRAAAAGRALVNARLGQVAADDVSDLARILRPAGTFNYKPERAVDGRPPPVRILRCEPDRQVSLDELLHAAPVGLDADAHAAPMRRATDRSKLPTALPARVAAALAALGVPYDVRGSGGRLDAVKLSRCPACGQTGCFVLPRSGRLKSWHQKSCPAAGAGIALDAWAGRCLPAGWDSDLRPDAETAERLARIAEQIADQEEIGRRNLEALDALVDEAASLTPLRDGDGAVRGFARHDGSITEDSFTGADELVAGGLLVAGSPVEAAEVGLLGGGLIVAATIPDFRALAGVVKPGRALVCPLDPEPLRRYLLARLGRRRFGRIVVIGGREDARPWRLLGDVVSAPGAGRVAGVLASGAGAIEAALSPDALVDFRAPTAIEDAGPLVRKAVIDAASHAARAGAGALALVNPPPGVGKSHAALAVLGELAAGGSGHALFTGEDGAEREAAVVFAAPSLKLAREKADEFQARGLGVAEVVAGALSHCDFADAARPLFGETGRHGTCGRPGTPERCPRADGDADRPPCPGAEAPRVRRGVVTFCAEALVPTLSGADLVVLDEAVGPLRVETATDEQIRSVYVQSTAGVARAWRRDHPDSREAARLLDEVATRLAREHSARVAEGLVPPHPRRITGPELRRTVESVADLPELVEAGFGEGVKAPPVPPPSLVRAGTVRPGAYPSRAAFRRLRELAEELAKSSRESLPILGQPEPPSSICLMLDPADGGRWSIESRRVARLPRAGVVILDAGAAGRLAELRAAYPTRQSVLFTVDADGERPAAARWIAGEETSRRKLAPRGRVSAGAVAILRRALVGLADEVRRLYPRVEHPRVELGLITFKPLAEALTGEGAVDGSPAARALAALREDLDALGVDVKPGYFGRDSRGTNRFERVHGFLVLGEPTPNLGATVADAGTLGLAADAESARLAGEELYQALCRPRWSRRAGVVLWALCRTDVRELLPEAAFEVGELPRSSAAAVVARELAFDAALRGEPIGVKPLRLAGAPASVSDHLLREASAEVAARLGWPRFDCEPGWFSVYASDLYSAVSWSWPRGFPRIYGTVGGRDRLLSEWLERGEGRSPAVEASDRAFLEGLKDEVRNRPDPPRYEPPAPDRSEAGAAGLDASRSGAGAIRSRGPAGHCNRPRGEALPPRREPVTARCRHAGAGAVAAEAGAAVGRARGSCDCPADRGPCPRLDCASCAGAARAARPDGGAVRGALGDGAGRGGGPGDTRRDRRDPGAEADGDRPPGWPVAVRCA